jgi:hypothetical protein
MNKFPGLRLWQDYTKKEFFKALLMGVGVTVLYAGIFLPPMIMVSMLYIPYIVYVLLLIYMVLSLSFSRGLTIMMETLQTYNDIETISFDKIQKRTTIVIAILIFVIESYIYITFLQ